MIQAARKVQEESAVVSWRTGLVFLVIVGCIAFTSARSFAQTVINITNCQSITSPGNYRLANDISGSTGNGQSCINIQSSDVTIDGNGKSITTTGDYAVLDLADSTPLTNLSVSNFTSAQGVWIYRSASNVTFDHVTVGGFLAQAADHVSVTNSTINGNVAMGNLGTENLEYTTFTGNTVTGSSDRLAVFSGDGHTVGNCDTTGYTINNNTFIDTITDTSNNPLALFLSCTENGSFSNNTVTSTGQATGLLIRDGYSHNSISGNTVHVNQSVNDSRGGMALVSGSSGGPSMYNTISGNIVIADNSKALFMYDATGTSTTGNLFQNNLFVSNSGSGSQEFYTTTDAANPNVFSHNTFVERGSGSALSFPDDGNVDGMKNTVLHDNIFVAASGSVIGGNTAIRSGFVANHNLYRNRSGAANFAGIGNFPAWRTAVGDTNSMEADPLFVDYTNGNYYLQAGSPALGAGTGGTNIGAYGLLGSCTESWTCGNWSTCNNSTQSRTCTDANNCGTTANRPPLTQSCTMPPLTTGVAILAPTNSQSISGTFHVVADSPVGIPITQFKFVLDGATTLGTPTGAYWYDWDTSSVANGTHTLTVTETSQDGRVGTSPSVSFTVNNAVSCVESWSCGVWSSCVNSTETRTCTDAHSCGTTTSRPALSQSCVMPDITPPAAVRDLKKL